MNPKRKHQLMHKLVVISNLLLENLDELKPDTPRMISLHSSITEFCEELNNSLADTTTIQKTTYFQNLANKVDTIIRKNFDENA
jgi:hypothetical protein